MTMDRNSVLTLLDQLLKMMPQLKANAVDSAVLFQQGNPKEAMERMRPVIGGLQSLMEGVKLVLTVETVRTESLRLNDKTFAQSRDSLALFLQRLGQCVRETRFVELADAMEYEFPPIVDEWTAIITELSNLCRQDN